MSEDKKTMNEVLKELNKKFGRTAVNYADKLSSRERIPFKQKALNDLTGGGVPRGQFTTIWGGSSCGKSSTILDLITEAQKRGLVCVYCDLEHSYDPLWAAKHGVDTSKLIYGDFSSAEEPMDALITFCKAQVADLIIVDSIQGLSPKGEQEEKGGKEKSVEQDTMALLARKLSQFFRMAAGVVSQANTAVVLVGQTRLDLGGFIKLETLSGGHALLHWSSIILHLRRGQKADAPTTDKEDPETGKKEKVIVGFNCVIKLNKCKVSGAVEGNEMSLPFYFQHGLTDGEAPLAVTVEEKPFDPKELGPCEHAQDVVIPTDVKEKKKRGRKAKGV